MAAASAPSDATAAPLRRCASRRLGIELVSGGIAGCVAKTCTAPLARLTVLAQTSTLLAPSHLAVAHGGAAGHVSFVNSGIWRGMCQIVRHEGMHALWKGNVCTLVHRFPFTGTSFLVVEAGKRCCHDLIQRHWWGKLLPGAVAACAATAVCYPLEVVRTRRMADSAGRCNSAWHRSLYRLCRKEGARGMYRGVGLALAVTVPSLATSFGIYAVIKDLATARGIPDSSFQVSFWAGGISGVIGSAVTFPLDVLRRRCQVMGMDPSVPTRSWLQEARHIFLNEGAAGFWRGIAPELVKVFPTVALTFMTYEQIRFLATKHRL